MYSFHIAWKIGRGLYQFSMMVDHGETRTFIHLQVSRLVALPLCYGRRHERGIPVLQTFLQYHHLSVKWNPLETFHLYAIFHRKATENIWLYNYTMKWDIEHYYAVAMNNVSIDQVIFFKQNIPSQ